MATKTKPESNQATKPRRATTSSPATDTLHRKRTTGTVTRRGSNVGNPSGATASNVPHYLRPTQSSRTASPKPGGKKEIPAIKPSPELTRRQSFGKAPQVAQLQRVKSTSTVPSSSRTTTSRPAELSKSLSLSSWSRNGNARPAELVKSNTMPKSGASSRLGTVSGSLSRLGSTVKTLKKSPVSSPSSKRQTVIDSNKQRVIAPEAELQVVIEEEKATPPPPIEDGSGNRDVIVVEGEEFVIVSTVKEDDSPPTDIDTSETPTVEEEEVSVDIEFHHKEGSSLDGGEIISSEDDQESGGGSNPPQPEGLTSAADAEESPTASVILAESDQTSVVPSKLLSVRPPAWKKKDSPVYNAVIEEAASKLLEKRKNKVRALVGAFETVISLQE